MSEESQEQSFLAQAVGSTTAPEIHTDDGSQGQALLSGDNEAKVEEEQKQQDEWPEWLQKRFGNDMKTALEKQAMSYNELRKLMGGHSGAPDEYEFNIKEFEDLKLDPKTDERLIKFAEVAKEHRLTQECFDNLLKHYFTFQEQDLNALDEKAAEQEKLFIQEELEKIDPDPNIRQTKILNLMQYFKSKFAVSENQLEAVLQTYADYALLEQIMRQTQKTTIPTSTRFTAAPALTRTQLMAKMSDPRYGSDPNYRREVDELYQQHFTG